MSSIHIEPQNLPDPAPDNHGKTRAAWVTNVGIVVGTVLAAIGFSWSFDWMTWTGGALVVISLITGAVMRVIGYGQIRKHDS